MNCHSSHLRSRRGRGPMPGHTHPPSLTNRHAPVVQHPSHFDNHSCHRSLSAGICVCVLPSLISGHTRLLSRCCSNHDTIAVPTPTLCSALRHLCVVVRQMSRKAGGTSESSSGTEQGGPAAELYNGEKPRCALTWRTCLVFADAQRALVPWTYAWIFFSLPGWMQNSSFRGKIFLELEDVISPIINPTHWMSPCCLWLNPGNPSVPNVPTYSANYRKSGNKTRWGYSEILTLQFQGIFASLKQLCLEEKCLKVKTPCYGL